MTNKMIDEKLFHKIMHAKINMNLIPKIGNFSSKINKKIPDLGRFVYAMKVMQ